MGGCWNIIIPSNPRLLLPYGHTELVSEGTSSRWLTREWGIESIVLCFISLLFIAPLYWHFIFILFHRHTHPHTEWHFRYNRNGYGKWNGTLGTEWELGR